MDKINGFMWGTKARQMAEAAQGLTLYWLIAYKGNVHVPRKVEIAFDNNLNPDIPNMNSEWSIVGISAMLEVD